MRDTPSIMWQKLPRSVTDDRVAVGFPIRLRKLADPAGKFWVVQVPIEADPNMPDGWDWADAWTNDDHPQRMEAGTRIAEAIHYVTEHLEQILDFAARQRSGWPHVDGVPPNLGTYISHYATDGERTYTSSEPPAESTPGQAVLVTLEEPPRQVQVDHVTDDDVQRRLAGVKLPTVDPYELIGVRAPNANGWPVLLELSSVQFAALLELSGDVKPTDNGRLARPLREIHTTLTNIDPRGR